MTKSELWLKQGQAVAEECLQNPVGTEQLSRDIEIDYIQSLKNSHLDSLERIAQRWETPHSDKPKVLEVGSYWGIVSISLARLGLDVTAQDRSELMSSPALVQRYEQAGVRVMSVDNVSQSLPYADASFDLLICCEMMEHLPFNSVRLVKEFRRVLKPNGLLFISVPNSVSLKHRLTTLLGRSVRNPIALWIAHPNADNWHWREYTEAEVQELLRGCGFSNVETGLRHYSPPAHPSALRRGILNIIYSFKPSFMDDIFAFAS